MENKKTLYKWHKRLGLSLGLVLFVLAISGLTITYRDELLPKVYSDLMLVTPTQTRTPLAIQIQAAKTFLKEIPFTHLYTSERDDTASMIFFRPEGAYLPHLLAIDPYNAQVRGTMPLIKNIFGLMLYVHANLLLGKTGSWIVGSMGLLVTFFFISGLMLWWPRNGWLSKLKLLPKNGLRGLHRGLGIFVGLPLVFSALTGFILAFDLLQPLGRMLGDAQKPEETVMIAECTMEQQLSALNLLSEDQQSKIVSIHFCSPKNGLMKFSYGLHERSGHDGYVRLIVNPRTLETLQIFDTTKDPTSWSANALLIYPMHTGAYFGGLGRILILICGFALATLYLTGSWPTIQRRLAARKKKK